LWAFEVCRENGTNRTNSKFWKLVPLIPFELQKFRTHTISSKGRNPFFGPFLEFGQAIVDAISVQKISNFWWTCSLVLASRRTNFYKIPIFGYSVMPQKQIFLVMLAISGSQKKKKI
jgi:hypothetical protein